MSFSHVFSNPGASAYLAAATNASRFPNVRGLPEVIVTGRANVGKSSLFNAVLGRTDLLHTSKKPGRTKSLNFYRVGSPPGHLVLVDAPGYGLRGRPEWGAVWNEYIETRKELRRIYVLINAKHGVTSFDETLLQELNSKLSSTLTHVTMQTVITKIDKLSKHATSQDLVAIERKIHELAPMCMPSIVTAVLKPHNIGIEEMRRSIAQACGLARV
ncbi:P-loop containing nucleoside triphosphate hydrolase protein [Rickenella mellea]|uniref:GTP-binding protein 8 n=1 Tax=Rickenella mellea TaxID=50990 RepID=A0A4Y7Q8S8_9AGAM|nr:P-loop containing nucleoside triphosphate hydrolase protein [Rickenella mellea]